MTPQELTKWRKLRYLNQVQLGRLLGKSRETIINWERGNTGMPDDLHVRLLAIDPKVEQEQVAQTSRITPASHPQLFTFVRDAGRHIPSRQHPNSLARRGLLGWQGCIWTQAHIISCTKAHPDILDSDDYHNALADLAAGRVHPGVDAVHRYFTTGKTVHGVTMVHAFPWPRLVLNALVEPLEGFNSPADVIPRPVPDSAWCTVLKALPDGYYWSETNQLILPDEP